MTAQPEPIEPVACAGGSSGTAVKLYPNLRSFPKGVSGNPSGRRKMDVVYGLLSKAGPRAMERIIELMEDEDPRIALVAAKEILDRAYGKPKQVEDDENDRKSVTINIVRLTDEKQGATSASAVTIRKFPQNSSEDPSAEVEKNSAASAADRNGFAP